MFLHAWMRRSPTGKYPRWSIRPAITPDERMEDYLRMAANLPEMDPETTYASMGKPTKPQEYGEEDAGGDMEPEDGE